MRGGTAAHRRGDHRDTLSSRNNLAGTYQSAGDLGRAIPLYEQTLADSAAGARRAGLRPSADVFGLVAESPTVDSPDSDEGGCQEQYEVDGERLSSFAERPV